MEDRRRSTDPQIDTLVMMVTENTKSIGELGEALNTHIKAEEDELKKHRDDIKPILDLQHDIATVGRFGRLLKQIVIWVTIVGGGFAAGWEYIEHVFQGKS